jgi:hypothetical protein
LPDPKPASPLLAPTSRGSVADRKGMFEAKASRSSAGDTVFFDIFQNREADEFFFFFFFLSILPAWVSSDDAAPKSPSLAPPAATGARGSVADRKGMFEAKAAYVKLCVFFVMFLFHRPSAHSFIFGQ